MAAKAKRRRWAAASGSWAVERLSFLDQLNDVRIAELMSLSALRDGNQSRDDVLRLKSLTIVAQCLNPSIVELCQHARETMDYATVLKVFERHDADRILAGDRRYEDAIDLAARIASDVCPVP
jgi:hypothetical protein